LQSHDLCLGWLFNHFECTVPTVCPAHWMADGELPVSWVLHSMWQHFAALPYADYMILKFHRQVASEAQKYQSDMTAIYAFAESTLSLISC